MKSKLTKEDVNLVVSRLPRDVVKLMRERGLILGGGFIRATISGEKPSDIDLFGESKDQLEAAGRKIAADRNGAKFHISKNAFTVLSGVRMPVQLVHRWVFSDPVECLKSFDFTVAQAAVWFAGEWKSCCADTFYSDLAARRLRYTSPQRNEDAGGSLLRVRKFVAKGYNIQPASFAAVIARLVSSVDKDSLGQGEAVTASVLLGLLHEVDPLIAVDGVDMVDEHEVQ